MSNDTNIWFTVIGVGLILFGLEWGSRKQKEKEKNGSNSQKTKEKSATKND